MSKGQSGVQAHIIILLLGVFFGIVLFKGQIISFYRMQEMFRLLSFHMYGIIGSAIIVAGLSLYCIKRWKVTDINGQQIQLKFEPFTKGHIIGGFIFGLGWAMTGACPGPIFALIGSGVAVAVVMLISAVCGVWMYGYFKKYLPQ